MEIEEEFCAKLESIKSDEERQVDIKPATLSKKYKVQSSQYSEVTLQSNNCISLLSRCRLCAIPDNDMVDIFSSPETEDILEKIQYSFSIMVTETDTLPKQICRFCLEELKRCYRFHKTVAEAQEQLLAFDKLVSIKSEKTDRNYDFFPTYSAQSGSTEYDNIDEPLETISDKETNNNKLANTAVKSNASLSSLRSCAVALPIIESCCKNSSDVENKRKSPSDTEHINTKIETLDIHVPDYVCERHYKCKSCEKTFKSKAYLSQHEKLHSGKGLHSCNYCQKKFTRKSDRNRHVRVHTNERPFKCLLCEKSFKEQSTLKLHTVAHSEERNHHCPVCDKSFKTLKVKNRHMEVHTRNKPWQCHYCGRTFLRKSNLKTHLIIYCKKRY